jgi:hemolysin activation/secretion protein
LFRFGGFRTLKGFDEESVLASSYLIFNLEQRFLLDANSWLYLFGNGGWLRNDAIGQNYRDTPYGLGAGITFQTNAGVFSVAYALGSERGAPLSFRNTKVHLGYRYLL